MMNYYLYITIEKIPLIWALKNNEKSTDKTQSVQQMLKYKSNSLNFVNNLKVHSNNNDGC